MSKAIDRRSFVSGAAMAGAVFAASATVPAFAEEPADSAASDVSAGTGEVDSTINRALGSDGFLAGYVPAKKWSWETAPEPIAEADIIDTTEADIVIVGGGIGGCAAACHAVELGDSVVVIEKTETVQSRGGHFGAVDSKAMLEAGIQIDKEELARQWVARCSDRCKEELVWLFINRSHEAMDWLIDKAETSGYEVTLYDGHSRNRILPEFPCTHMFGGEAQEGQGALTVPVWVFYQGALEGGAQFVFNMAGQQLVTDDAGAVIGVDALGEDGYHRYLANKGVILAAGDFAGDPEMLECYAPICLRAPKSYYTPVGANTGDMHKAAMWVGGQMECASVPTSLHLVAYTWQAYGFLHVNSHGKRFMNENNWTQAKSIKILQQPGDADYAWSIFDSDWPTQLAASMAYGGGQFWDGMGRLHGQIWSPESDQAMLESNMELGSVFQADTLEELAELIGVDKDTFLATVERYNELSVGGKDLDFGKEPELMNTIMKPPFYAAKFGPAVMGTNGGILVDECLRVVDKNQDPIPGLYAIGNNMGGRYGNDYPTLINGSTHGTALTFGYLAPEFIDADAQ